MRSILKLKDNRFGEQPEVIVAVKKDNGKYCLQCKDPQKNAEPQWLSESDYGLLREIQGTPVQELKQEAGGNLILYSPEDQKMDDWIFRITHCSGNLNAPDSFRIETGNVMGVLNLKNKSGDHLQLQIGSRFDAGAEQYFLNYLLASVFRVSFTEIVTAKDEALWDLMLAFVFLWKFGEAAPVGLYKQYHTNRNNDLNFRGKFDLDRHLKLNYPLGDKIAYSKREITFDNPLNHLLRFAADKVARKWPAMLDMHSDVRELLTALKQATPTWIGGSPASILNHKDTRFPVRQPYFSEVYEPLRRIARMLLQNEGANVYDSQENDSETEISGVLFDGSWLWEEYIATILTKYRHARYPDIGGIPVFKKRTSPKFFPDFWNETNKIVLDTKYKRAATTGQRSDIHQVLCYMFLTGATRGGLIYPPGENDPDINENFLDIDSQIKGTWRWKNFSFANIREKDIKDVSAFESFMQQQEDKLRNFAKFP